MARLQYGWTLSFGLLATLLIHSLAFASKPPPISKHVSGPFDEQLAASTSFASSIRADVPPTNTFVRRFVTEPDPGVEQLNFELLRVTPDRSLLAPGYLLFTISGPDKTHQGSVIYDTAGNLVWFWRVKTQTQDFHVCDYLGEVNNHLCLHVWLPRQKEVLNQNYKLVTHHYSGLSDSHEFNSLPGGHTYLSVGDRSKHYDLRPYGGAKNGWVLDSCLFEIDMKTGREIFKWCYLDDLPIWATHLWMQVDGPLGAVNASRASRKAGNGTIHSKWSIVHINAADKINGDYIVSLRHVDQLVRIAGAENRHGVKPGTVLWRLGGTGSDIELQNFNFTRQHHVRVHSETADYTTLSIFNNAWEGTNPPSANQSSGMVIGVDKRTMKAELIQAYIHPSGALAESRGSTQVLPNGNVFVGYGRYPDLIEYDRNGSILWHARFSRFKPEHPFPWRRNQCSYRAYKQNWTGLPEYPPKVVAYARTCKIKRSSPIVVYVSWNGATEVASWRMHTSITAFGPWSLVGTFQKTGFETEVRLKSLEGHAIERKQFLSVEGLRSDGTVLGKTKSRVFVPNNRIQSSCNEHGCYQPNTFDYGRRDSLNCTSWTTWTIELVCILCFIEMLSLLYMRLWHVGWDFRPINIRNGDYTKVSQLDKDAFVPESLEGSDTVRELVSR